MKLVSSLKPFWVKVTLQPPLVTLQKRTIADIEIAQVLKRIYNAFDLAAAKQGFMMFQDKWGRKYPDEIKSWEKDYDVLFTFMKYPHEIRCVIYTTNWIERTIKEFRKRLRPMNNLPQIEAAEKIIYLQVQQFNETWSSRKIRGFASAILNYKICSPRDTKLLCEI